MASETIFQSNIFQQFILPFVLVFTLIFGVLEKTKLLGEGKKQLNAIIALVVGLIFVTAIFPKVVVGNLILFLTIALVVMFVILLLWGFVFGEIKEGFTPPDWMKWTLGILIGLAVIIAIIWAVGGSQSGIIDFLFKQDWSNTFWTNFAFVIVIVIALVLILKNKGSGK